MGLDTSFAANALDYSTIGLPPNDRKNVINSAHLKRRRLVLMKKQLKFVFGAPPVDSVS
jgi:hypothetical protein